MTKVELPLADDAADYVPPLVAVVTPAVVAAAPGEA